VDFFYGIQGPVQSFALLHPPRKASGQRRPCMVPSSFLFFSQGILSTLPHENLLRSLEVMRAGSDPPRQGWRVSLEIVYTIRPCDIPTWGWMVFLLSSILRFVVPSSGGLPFLCSWSNSSFCFDFGLSSFHARSEGASNLFSPPRSISFCLRTFFAETGRSDAPVIHEFCSSFRR